MTATLTPLTPDDLQYLRDQATKRYLVTVWFTDDTWDEEAVIEDCPANKGFVDAGSRWCAFHVEAESAIDANRLIDDGHFLRGGDAYSVQHITVELDNA